MWAYNKNDGSVSAKLVYECIVASSSPLAGSSILKHFLLSTLPRKICCFVWLALMNKLLTWDNLQKRGRTGPGICALCRKDIDNIQHLFFTAQFGGIWSLALWNSTISLLTSTLRISVLSWKSGLIISLPTQRCVISLTLLCGLFGRRETYIYF